MNDRRKDDPRLEEMHGWIKDIHTTIYGNGALGLKTKVELNKQAIGRMWYLVGGISLLVVGTAIKVVAF